jgi:hypothetical protein
MPYLHPYPLFGGSRKFYGTNFRCAKVTAVVVEVSADRRDYRPICETRKVGWRVTAD